MPETDNKKTNEKLALDVMKYAYRDTDGVLYTINAEGKRIVAPEGTLALSAEYQAVADQTAAIMMTFRKVKKLTKEERGMLPKLLNGTAQVTADMSTNLREAYAAAKEQSGIEVPGSDAWEALKAFGGAIAVPYKALKGLIETGEDIKDQWGGENLTEEQALSIGTAFASAAQVASESHDGFEFSHTFDYLVAALKFATSWVCDTFGLDKEHKLGWHKEGGFVNLVKDEVRGGDNTRIEKKLQELEYIGGEKTTDLSFLTNSNSTFINTSGKQSTVKSADSSNAAPTLEGEKTPKNPEEVKNNKEINPPTGGVEGTVNVLKEKVQNGAKQFVNDHPYATGAGLLVGADIAHGVARGTMSKMVGKYNASEKKIEGLTKDLKVATEGKPGVTIAGKEFGGTKPNPELAEKLKGKLEVATERSAIRREVFGETATKFAESASPFGKRDILNRGGALLGKGIGTIGSNLMTIAEKGAHKSSGAKMIYGMDAIQGGFALLQGDMHGVTENVAQIGGGWAGSKYGTAAAETAIIRFVPGKFKPLAVAGVGLFSFFGGRKLGELGSNLISPKAEAVEASVQTAAAAEFSKLDETLLAQGVNTRLVGGDQINALRTLANTPEAYAQMAAQLEQQGVIAANVFTPEQKVSAVKSLQKMVQLEDNILKEASKEQRDAEKKVAKVNAISEGAELGFNASVIGTGVANSLRTLGPLASGASKAAAFIPGPIRTGIMAVGDVWNGGKAAMNGDRKSVAHSTGRVAGGLLTAIAASAGTGALAGSVFPGLGNLAGGIIGGLAGAAGYYFGSKAGGSIADSITGYDENAPVPTAVATTTKPSVEMDPGLAAAMKDPNFVASMKADKEVSVAILTGDFKKLQSLAMRHGQSLAINGAKVSVGAVSAPTGSSAPQTTQTDITPLRFS